MPIRNKCEVQLATGVIQDDGGVAASGVIYALAVEGGGSENSGDAANVQQGAALEKASFMRTSAWSTYSQLRK